mgnify:CR=1 FL=1
MCWYRWQHDTLMLGIRLQPYAGKDEIIGEYDGRLKIALRHRQLMARLTSAYCNLWRKFARYHYDSSASSAA